MDMYAESFQIVDVILNSSKTDNLQVQNQGKLCKSPRNTNNDDSRFQISFLYEDSDSNESFTQTISSQNSTTEMENKQIEIKSNKSTSSTSSEEAFLQTRFSVNNTKFNEKEQNKNSSNNSLSKMSDEESYVENSEIKHSTPLKIEMDCTEHDAKSKRYKKNFSLFEIEQSEIKSDLKKYEIDLVDDDSTNFEAKDFTDKEKRCIKQLPDDNAQSDFDIKRDSINKDRNEILQNLMKKITVVNENDSVQSKHELKPETDDFIIQDFFNGSLDLNSYRLDRQPSKYIEKTMKFEDELTVMETNADIVEKNNLKSKISNSTNKGKKSNLSKVSPINRKQSNKGLVKNAKQPGSVKKRNSKVVKKITNPTRQRNKPKNQLLNHHEEHSALSNINMQNESANGYSNKFNKNGLSDDINSSIKPSRCHKRNSSVIASRKIREIKELENSDSSEKTHLSLNDETDNLPISSNLKYDTRMYNFETENLNKSKYTAKNRLATRGNNHKKSTLEEVHSDESMIGSNKKSKVKNTRLPKNNTKYNFTSSNTFNNSKTSNLKQSVKKNVQTRNNYLASDFNQPVDYVEENTLYSNLYTDMETVDKSNYRGDSKIKKYEIYQNNKNATNKNELIKNEHQSTTYNGSVTRRRKRTWDMLEKELDELEHELLLTNNGVETVASEEKQLAKKRNLHDFDIQTSLNRKNNVRSTKEDKYNTKYVRKKECKYLKSEANTCRHSNELNRRQLQEIIPSTSKSISIVEKTIAAMSKCNSQSNMQHSCTTGNGKKQSLFELESASNISNSSPEALFQSSVMFMNNENAQYYKNEIVGYLKRSVRRDQNVHSNKRKNMDNVKHVNESDSAAKSYKRKNYSTEKLNEISRAVAPISHQDCNPWNKLMKELNADDDDIFPKKNFNTHCEPGQIAESLAQKDNLNKRLNKCQKQKAHKMIKLDQEEISIQDEEATLLVNPAPQSSNFDNFSLTVNVGSNKSYDQNKISKSNNECILEKKDKYALKLKRNKIETEKMHIMKSPKLKHGITHGNLKLKQHPSRNTLINNSEKCKLSKQNIMNLKNNDPNSRESNSKNLFEKDNSVFKNTHAYVPTKSVTKQWKEKENLADTLRSIKRRMNIKLIAVDEDDVFSLSSDSEA